MKQRTKVNLLATTALVGVLTAVGVGIFAWQVSRENDQLRANQIAPFADLSVPSFIDPLSSPFSDPLIDPLQNWDPMAEIEAMEKRMRDFQNGFGSDQSFFNKFGLGLSTGQPQIEMQETPEAYKVIVTVPQGQEVTVNTNLEDDRLSISGEVKSENFQQDNGASSTVRATQKFSQTVYLATEVDQSKMTTEQNGDKMIITLPKVS